MQREKPTKQDVIDALRRIASRAPGGRVSLAAFQDDTGWDKYWFDRYWPETGYRGACEEAGVLPGLMVSVDISCRKTDEEVSLCLAAAIERNELKFPTLARFKAISKIGPTTICRGELYEIAKKRLIHAYLSLSTEKRESVVEQVMLAELRRLDGSASIATTAAQETVRSLTREIVVSQDYLATVVEFRDRGEEEQRQLVGRFFVEILGYRRSRVRSEHERNDVRVYDRRDRPWLVVEVKPVLGSDRHRHSARRQGFDYAHRRALRYVVISDGDFYEIYDRFAGERLAYSEMLQGSFQLSALRSRDTDLLNLLAAES